MDSQQDFQRAKDALQFNDAYLKSTSCLTDDDFDPKSANWDELVYQFIHVVKGSEVVSLTNSEGEESQYFRVFVDVGCRFIAKNEQENEEPAVLSKIEASFCSEYLMLDPSLEEDALKVFALQNVSYHIWPFWREYLMNMCSRLNLPKVPLPTMQIKPQNGDSGK